MKYSDLMLDRACGEASIHDAYIEEAKGKINVANAIYAQESKVAVFDGDESYDCVQESASVGLPTDKAAATAVSCEAIKEQLSAFYDLIVSTAKKVRDSSDKNMKLLIAFGKKNGITNTGDIKSFANSLADAFAGASFSDRKFIKGKYALKTAKAYGKGMQYLLAGYGVQIDGSFDDVVTDVIGSKMKDCNVQTLKCIEGKLSDGGDLMATEKITSKDGHYTDKVRTSDLIDYTVALYTILTVSKTVADIAGKNKKTAMATMNSCCDDSTLKARKLTRSCNNINDDIKDWTSNLTTVVDSISTAFGDSIYALNTATSSK